MDDNVTVPRATVEAFIQVAKNVLEDTKSGAPDRLERAEVTVVNNERSKLKEAVYQAERAIYEIDTKSNTAAQMSANAEKRRRDEDDYSQSKENWIAR